MLERILVSLQHDLLDDSCHLQRPTARDRFLQRDRGPGPAREEPAGPPLGPLRDRERPAGGGRQAGEHFGEVAVPPGQPGHGPALGRQQHLRQVRIGVDQAEEAIRLAASDQQGRDGQAGMTPAINGGPQGDGTTEATAEATPRVRWFGERVVDQEAFDAWPVSPVASGFASATWAATDASAALAA